MNAWTTGGSVIGAAMMVAYLGDRLSTTVHTRLDRLPHQLLRCAIRRLDADIRPDIAPDWTAELDAILHRHNAGPIPLIRLLAGAWFAAGLLRTAKLTSGYLAAKPQLLDTTLRAAFRGAPEPEDNVSPGTAISIFLFWLIAALVLAAGPARTAAIALAILAAGVSGLVVGATVVALVRGLILLPWQALRGTLRPADQPQPQPQPRPWAHDRPSSSAATRNAGDAPDGPTAKQPPDHEHPDHGATGNPDLRPSTGRAIRHPATRAAYSRYQRGKNLWISLALPSLV